MLPKFNIKCLISGAQTGGVLAGFEETVEHQTGPPLHVHKDQMEIFHIISGALEFEVEGVRSIATAGGTAVVPAGLKHTFRNVNDGPTTFHFELLPAGKSEECFARLSAGDVGDPEVFFEEYGMVLAGPPLE